MLSVKARDTTDTIFKVFGMTQLRINPSLHASQANALTTRQRSWHLVNELFFFGVFIFFCT